MEQFIPEEKLREASQAMIGSFRKNSVFKNANMLLSQMSGSISLHAGIPASLLGNETPQNTFEELVRLHERFSKIFQELLQDSIELPDIGPNSLRWEGAEARVVPVEVKGTIVKLRLAIHFIAPQGFLVFSNDAARWKE
jgi:hypothetical protein